MIYAKTIVPGLNRFYRGHFQNTPNIKTFFGYATRNGLSVGHILVPQGNESLQVPVYKNMFSSIIATVHRFRTVFISLSAVYNENDENGKMQRKSVVCVSR